MAGVDEVHLDAIGHRHRPVVADRLKMRQRAERIGFGVERQRGRVFRELLAVRDLGIIFLDAAGIREHDAAEILGARRAEHAPGKTLRDEPRQISTMIEMRVRQDDGVDFRGFDWQVLPVALPQFLQTLKQSGIDQDPGRRRLEQVPSIR